MRLRFTVLGVEVWALEFDREEAEYDYPIGSLDPDDDNGRLILGGE